MKYLKNCYIFFLFYKYIVYTQEKDIASNHKSLSIVINYLFVIYAIFHPFTYIPSNRFLVLIVGIRNILHWRGCRRLSVSSPQAERTRCHFHPGFLGQPALPCQIHRIRYQAEVYGVNHPEKSLLLPLRLKNVS